MSNQLIEKTKIERKKLENALNQLIKKIGNIPIANQKLMPYGWRNAAKGRTVWRIVEEIINQNIIYHSSSLGFKNVYPSASEVSVFDFKFSFYENEISYVNIKSAVINGKINKDDISKAQKLIDFYNNYHSEVDLFIATFVVEFKNDLTIELKQCIVFPVAWIPDIYVNPSNNNLQSSKYKDISNAVYRTPKEFFEELKNSTFLALEKKKNR